MTEATGGTAVAEAEAGGRPPHVAMLVTPGMGHLIPLAELAKRLAARHGVTAMLITFASTASATQRAFLASLPPAIASLSLPPVDLSDLPADAAIETLMSEECVRIVPALTHILSDLKDATNLVAFVADLFGADSFDAAAAAGVARRYLFFPTNLHVLTLLLALPDLDASMPGEFRDLADPVRLPGCVPIPGPDILSPLQDKSNPCYRWMVHHGTRYRDAHAILVNSFDAVEPDAARALRAPHPGRPPVHNIGPLIKTDDDASTRAPCLEWLDRQPPKSVIFVSFGSGGSLPAAQMRELALGLELSGQRFLWVVRSPSDEGAVNANYYDAESKKDGKKSGTTGSHAADRETHSRVRQLAVRISTQRHLIPNRRPGRAFLYQIPSPAPPTPPTLQRPQFLPAAGVIRAGCSPHRRRCVPRRWAQLVCSACSIPAGNGRIRWRPRSRHRRSCSPACYSTPACSWLSIPAGTRQSMPMLLGHTRGAAGLLCRLHTPVGSGHHGQSTSSCRFFVCDLSCKKLNKGSSCLFCNV